MATTSREPTYRCLGYILLEKIRGCPARAATCRVYSATPDLCLLGTLPPEPVDACSEATSPGYSTMLAYLCTTFSRATSSGLFYTALADTSAAAFPLTLEVRLSVGGVAADRERCFCCFCYIVLLCQPCADASRNPEACRSPSPSPSPSPACSLLVSLASRGGSTLEVC